MAVSKIWPASQEKKLTFQLEKAGAWDTLGGTQPACKEASGSLLKASLPGTAEALPHGGCWPQEMSAGLCLAVCRCVWERMPPWARWLHWETDKVRNLIVALLALIGWLYFFVLVWIWIIWKKIVTRKWWCRYVIYMTSLVCLIKVHIMARQF